MGSKSGDLLEIVFLTTSGLNARQGEVSATGIEKDGQGGQPRKMSANPFG